MGRNESGGRGLSDTEPFWVPEERRAPKAEKTSTSSTVTKKKTSALAAST